MREAEDSFAKAIREAGLDLEGAPIMDGEWHRVPTIDGRRGNKNGSYKGYLDGKRPAGIIQNFKDGLQVKWVLDGKYTFSAADIAALKEAAEKRARERAEQYEKAAKDAQRRWNRARPVAKGETTPYLARKRVGAFGVRTDGTNTFVPARDAAGNIHALQTIFPEKRALKTGDAPIDKVFNKDSQKDGHFHIIGELKPGQPAWIAEGYATAASVHMATGQPAVMAFDSGNLDAVITAIKAAHPDVPLFTAADDDIRNKVNAGRQKAEAAATKHGVPAVFPQFTGDPGNRTDFNDLHVSEGLDAVKTQLEQFLSQHLARSEATMSEQDAPIPEAGKQQDQAQSAQMTAQPAGATEPPPAFDWGEPDPGSAERAALDKARFEQAKQQALANPEEAAKTDAGAFALAQATGSRPVSDFIMVDAPADDAEKAEQARREADVANAQRARDIMAGTVEPINTSRTLPEQEAVDLARQHIATYREIGDSISRGLAVGAIAKMAQHSEHYAAELRDKAPDLVQAVARHNDLNTRPNAPARDDKLASENIIEPAATATQASEEARPAEAPAVENVIEPAPAATVTADPAPAANPLHELDPAALEVVKAARAKQSEEVRQQLKEAADLRSLYAWNVIEPAETLERKPAAQAAPASAAPTAPTAQPAQQPAEQPVDLTKPVVISYVVPEDVANRYLRTGNRFYIPSNPKHVAFEDHGEKLKTAMTDDAVANDMVKVAKARGWSSIKVSGAKDFCRTTWLAASLQGMEVQGYKPTEMDLADLQRRMAHGAQNKVEAKEPQASNQVAATAPQGGMYISAEDAALLAAAKAAGWGQKQSAQSSTAAAPSPAPAAPTVQATVAPAPAATAAPAAPQAPAEKPAHKGDILIAHGPAPYRHDKTNPQSYYVILENTKGQQRTVWGVQLGEAIAKSGVQIGQPIILEKNGQDQVEVDANVKDEKGRVVGTEKIGALRNQWKVKALAFSTLSPEQAVQQHPDLAGAYGKMAHIDKQAEADGYTPSARAVIADQVRKNLAESIARGEIPQEQIRETVEIKEAPRMAMAR